jgi:deazaflavin-dependent oxidoreductase (nitroreductase family)
VNDPTVKWLSEAHTLLYRATNGLIGRRLVNNDMLLLTTTGRKTGDRHTVPLLYLNDDERLIIIASYGGRPNHPSWYENLLVDPIAEVQILGRRRTVTALTMGQEERATWWPEVVAAYSDYAVYQSKTDRVIPLVWLA